MLAPITLGCIFYQLLEKDQQFNNFFLISRYSLSEEKLIRQQVEYHQMTVFVSMSPQTIYMSGLDPQGDNMDIPVRCLDCDSISQVCIAFNFLLYFFTYLLNFLIKSIC